MTDIPLEGTSAAVSDFTAEDRMFLEYAIDHNLGARLSEALKHLFAAYDALRRESGQL